MNTYSWLWASWILMFCVIEGFAITNGVPEDTLSENVWRLIGTDADNRTAVTWAWRAGLLLLFAWLIPHFFTGWNWFK